MLVGLIVVMTGVTRPVVVRVASPQEGSSSIGYLSQRYHGQIRKTPHHTTRVCLEESNVFGWCYQQGR